jgi:aminoglycoside phosphotransferase (APT) family kinase protein
LPGAALDQLGAMLAGIHRIHLGLREVVPAFAPFYELDRIAPPPATKRPDLWHRAIDAVTRAPVPARSIFMHRDFHPGNTLWRRGRLTGVVDWTLASWGPPAADLAHLRANLGIDQGVAAADRAAAAFVAAGGDVADRRYWDIAMLLDMIGDLYDDLAEGEGLERVQRYLAALLD